MTGKKRKNVCSGCRPRDKGCSFLKDDCEKLTKRSLEYCFECEDFPCKNLEHLDELYRQRYGMSMIENLKQIEENGIQKFIEEQENEYRCPDCGGTICVHTNICYNCETP